MKKLFALLLVCGTITSAKAQLFYAQGGANFANITKNGDGDTEDNNILTTFNVGLMGRLGLSKTIDIESGLLLTGRGAKAETYFNSGNDYVKAKFNPLYIEVPVNLIVNVPMTGSTKLFFNAGPYAAIGIAGKSKLETKFGPLTTSSTRDIEFSNDDPFTSEQDDAVYDKLKRFDFGLNAGVGFDLSSFIIKANYGFGLTKINSTESNNNADDKNKYRTLSISVGIPLSR